MIKTTALSALTALALLPVSARAEMMVHDPVSYETSAGLTTGAALMGLHSDQDDRLVAASSPVAERVEIHSTTEDNGIMKMREEKDGLVLPKDKVVKLEAGGYHLMLMGLKEPLKAGTNFDLTLTFEKAGTKTVTVPVKSRAELKEALDGAAPDADHHGHHDH